MNALLSIKTIPFQYELKVSNAQLNISNPQPEHKMKRQPPKLNIKHTPSRISIDSSAVRESFNHLTPMQTVSREADKGMAAAKEAGARYSQEGAMMKDTRNTTVFADIGNQRTKNTLDTMLGFIPTTPSKIEFSQHELSIQYEAEKLSFDWRSNSKPKMEFSPASIEMLIKEYARLEVEYIGGPIYTPKSADPNYQPPPNQKPILDAKV